MDDKFITTDYRTDCYNCRHIVEQHIHIMPNRTDVTCGHCGATRVFIPLNEDVDMDKIFEKKGRWSVWSLIAPGICRNCGINCPHEITVSCRNIKVRCNNCHFTHLYRFNFEYMAADDKESDKATGLVTGHSICP